MQFAKRSALSAWRALREAPASMSSRCWLGPCGIPGSVIASIPARIPRLRVTLLKVNAIRHAEGNHKFHRAGQFIAVLNKNLQLCSRWFSYWFDLCSEQVGPLTMGWWDNQVSHERIRSTKMGRAGKSRQVHVHYAVQSVIYLKPRKKIIRE